MLGLNKMRIFILIAIGISALWRNVILGPVAFRPVDLHISKAAHRTVVIAGGTSGIGLAAAKQFAAWQAYVVIGARDMKKGAAVQREIKAYCKEIGHEGVCSVTVYQLDLAKFSSVQRFANDVISSFDRVDTLVLNAGMHGSDDVVTTIDGIEETYQTNFVSHHLLTQLLLPKMKATTNGTKRIVHTSSSMHYLGELDHDAHSAEAKNAGPNARTGVKAYCDTKLMNVVYSNYLDRTLGPIGFTSVATHPGLVTTDLDRNQPPMVAKIMKAIRSATSRPAMDGAVTLVTAATLPNPGWVIEGGRSGKSGVYLEDQCIMNDCTTPCTACLHMTADAGGGMVPHKTADSIEEQDWLVAEADKMIKRWRL
jgi:NAD(P)-dependent dehydrogenase (short-subunit alcohol dehydrogenase family)